MCKSNKFVDRLRLKSLGLVITFIFCLQVFSTQASQQLVGDIDGNSETDLFSINSLNQLEVQTGDGLGGFASPVTVSTDFSLTDFELGDFNGDGFEDLLALNGDGDLCISLHDQVDGYLDDVVLSLGLVGTEGLADYKLGFINEDSFLDAIVLVDGLINARVLLLHGNGSGGFGAPVTIELTTLLSLGQSLHLEYINSDDVLDIAVRDVTGTVRSLLSDGLGSYGTPVVVPGILPLGNIYFADHNSDGIADLLVLDQSLGLLTLRLGNGDGTFASGVSFMVGLTPVELISIDINHDGHMDTVVVNTGDNTINVLLGDSLGGLVELVGQGLDDLLGIIPSLSLPANVVSADFNGDCRLDLALWLSLTGEYLIVMNQAGPDSSDLIFCHTFGAR